MWINGDQPSSGVHSTRRHPQPAVGPFRRRMAARTVASMHPARTVASMHPARLDDLVPLLDPTAVPRVLGRADALLRGYNPNMITHRLATAQWRRILPRTYLTVDTLTWHDRLTAAFTFAGPGALLSGAAALANEGLAAITRPSRILVLVTVTNRLRSTASVRIRATRRLAERAMLPGPACAPLSRAVADVAHETPSR